MQKKPVYKISPKQYKETLAYLQTQYPKCFTNPSSPLAISIHKEIFNEQQEHLSKTIIKYFLILYCSKIAYRNSLILGANRIGLYGNVTSVVTEDQVPRTIAKANHLVNCNQLLTPYYNELLTPLTKLELNNLYYSEV